ncbi:hypothetical protein IWZ00DRAFT_309310 [Phyllosticta capitalensis]
MMSTLCVVSGMKRAPRKQKRRVVCFKTSDVTGCGPRLPRSGEVPAVVWWAVVLATSDRGELSGARALSSAARQLSCCCCNSLTPRPHLANTPPLLRNHRNPTRIPLQFTILELPRTQLSMSDCPSVRLETAQDPRCQTAVQTLMHSLAQVTLDQGQDAKASKIHQVNCESWTECTWSLPGQASQSFKYRLKVCRFKTRFRDSWQKGTKRGRPMPC